MALFKTENLTAAGNPDDAPAKIHSVMVVDDVRANAAVMAAILRPHFHLIEAHDADEALALIDAMPAAQDLACIVSDHRMPRLTGVELFKRLLPLLPHTRRILVTGYMDMDAVVAAINDAAIYRFIAKPFDAGDFLLAVRSAVAAFEADRLQRAAELALTAVATKLPHDVAVLQEAARDARARQAALEAQLRASATE